MPVYEYVCEDCNAQFQKRVPSFKDADTVACQSCSSSNIQRMISRVAFVGGGSRDIPVSTGASASVDVVVAAAAAVDTLRHSFH